LTPVLVKKKKKIEKKKKKKKKRRRRSGLATMEWSAILILAKGVALLIGSATPMG
jgi:hypothetical protein